MVIKKTIQCPTCKRYKSYLIEERQSFVGIRLKCECGKHHVCTKQTRHFTKWEEVEPKRNPRRSVENEIKFK